MSLSSSPVWKKPSKMTNKFHILSDEQGRRLDIFLSERLSITRTKIKEMVEGGYVRADGKLPKASLQVRRSMVIEGEIPQERDLSFQPQQIPLHILYEDASIMAINKPAGMVVHPSFGHSEGTLVNALLGYLGKEPYASPSQPVHCDKIRPGIVHRLDKGTTGVIIVAKDPLTQEMLSSLFKERDVRKTYRAIIEGSPKNDEGSIEGNIGRHPTDRKKMTVLRDKGRQAFTAYRVKEKLKGFSYLEAYPRTGRTHQIRVHLAHIGHPVVGDEKYGRSARTLAARPLLHAWKLEFVHPLQKTPLSIEAPVPEDMMEFLRRYAL
jgi:23S rRNA pseudouridine1911/1915/1917 synthase